MRQSNVVPFPPTGQAGEASVKLFAMAFYLFLAYMFTAQFASAEGEGLGFLILLALCYNLFIRRRLQVGNYLRKNGLLLLLLLLLLVLVFQWQILPVLGIMALYWLMIGRGGREAPYFLRFHLLTALTLNFLLLLVLVLFNALAQVVLAVFGLLQTAGLSIPDVTLYMIGLPWLVRGVFWLPAVYLAVSALCGRTPYIGVVTGNVRHWA